MTMFSFKQYWFLLFSFLTLSCFSLLTFAQLQFQLRLHPNEVVVLRKIAEKIGATLKQNLTDDPCQLQRLPIDDSGQSQSVGKGQNNTIACSLTDTVDGNSFLHITTISFQSLSLPGLLPPEFANLTFLQTIDLTRNYLNGSLPKEWASLRHLKTILLTGNRLTGEIPPEWGNFANLTYLSLEANQLSGTIPDELGNLVNLTVLILSSNQFVGSLPVALGNINNLKDLVSDNSFNGTVPEFIGEWTNLERLEMYSSGLEGPIPTAIFDLENLKDLRISDMTVPNFTFPNLSSKNIEILVLRSLNMSGSIPTDIWEIDNTIDLTFNNLGGEINSNEADADFTFLSGNMLTGNVPDSFLSSDDYIDISYNSLKPLNSCPDNSKKVNMYLSFSSDNSTNERLSCPSRSSCKKYYQSLHINCGGADEIVNNTRYEGDRIDDETEEGAIMNYFSGTKWGFISVGDFMDDDNKNDDGYTLSTDDKGVSKLYSTARVAPLFLSYYAYCMENGDYTVNLHFAEILFKDEEPYNRVGKRIFDIYIQGRLEYKDFNIKEIANGTGKEIKRSFSTTVTDHTLEIRLYWAGKGTTCIPIRGTYGPLISAISVCQGFKSNCDEPKNINNVSIVVGVVTPVLFIILCALVFCWRRYSRQKSITERDLQLGTFTYRQLKAATNNFDSANKIGEGGFGSVYKGQLSDGTFIAVKQLSSKSRQGNREFVNEIGMISGLQHPNLVKLFGCCVAGNQLLLIYEYMENNCLAHALFGTNITLKLDWTTRQKICVGVAKGVAYLHEGSTLRIVHRDIKATNVLLDKELNAKISDFGLAKLKEDGNTHISTRIAGTIGYMAPEYALWGYLTEKADVYSFGVVALEIVSGRNNASYRAESESVSLLDWAFDLQQRESLFEIVDPKLEYKFNKEQCERMIKVALLCCNDSPALRPTMSEVVCMLEEKSNAYEVISDPSNYGTDLQSKQLKGHNQHITPDQLSSGSTTSYFSSHKTGLQSSSTSVDDLYPINSESIRNLTSDHDLYPVSSETLSLKLGDSSLHSHHCSLV